MVEVMTRMGEVGVKVSRKALVPKWEREANEAALAAWERFRDEDPEGFLDAIERGLNERFPRIAGGAAGAWTLTNAARTNFLNGTTAFSVDTFKIALFLSTSNIGAASTTYAGVTNEHANGNGYTTGGAAVTVGLSGTTSVAVTLTDVTWTSSGTITARFAVLYEVSGNVVAYCLLDSTPADVTVASPNTLTVDNTNLMTVA